MTKETMGVEKNMGVETQITSDEYANQSFDFAQDRSTDPAYLMSVPSPSMGEGEGEGEGGDPVAQSDNPLPLVRVDVPGEELPVWVREDLVDQYLQELEANRIAAASQPKDSYTEVTPDNSQNTIPFAGYWNHFVDDSIHPVQRGVAGVFLPVMAPVTVAAGFLSSPFGCAIENNDRTLQPENDAPGGNEGEGETDGPERIPPPKDGAQPDMIVADGGTDCPEGDCAVDGGDDDGAVGDDDATVGDDDGGVDEPVDGGDDDDGAVDGGDDDGGSVDPVDDDEDGYVADVDCNDNDATVHQILYGFNDVDGEGYTVGPLQAICSGAGLPAGFRSVSLGEDCNDSDPTLYQNLTAYADIDGDGYTVGGAQTLCSGAELAAGYSATSDGEDCDDLDVSINPSATEFAYDGIDQDCNGADVTDVDGDGVAAVAADGADCDDGNLTIYPGAVETPYNGVDEDCNGGDITDVDGDGFDALAVAGGTDCNDDLAYIHPGAEQRLNGIDTNCDGNLDIDLARDSVVFRGEDPDDLSGIGQSVAYGDVNGDGFQDVIVGAPDHNTTLGWYDYVGRAYILLGGAGEFLPGSTYDLATADVMISGACGWDLGLPIATRDLNNDGKDDLLIGVPGYNSGVCGGEFGDGDGSATGAILIAYGRDAWEPSYSFYDIDSTDAVVLSAQQMALIKGNPGNGLGTLFTVEDIDGNGSGEIVVGNGSCNIIPAQAYEGIRTTAEIMATEGGYRIYQRPDTYLPGYDCTDSAFGDIDGDGLTDILTADSYDDEYSGAGKVFTIFGSDSLPAEINVAALSSYEGLRYLTFRGNAPGVTAGSSVAVGDLDGDGKADVIIGVPEEDTDVSNPGKVYQIPGSAITNAVNGVNPDFPNGSDIILDGDVYLLGGSAIYGGAENTRLSALGMSAEGDANSDGLSDLIVGAGWISRGFYFDGATLTGMVTDEISSSAAEHQMIGTESGNFGLWLKGGADVNGDGASDTFVNDRVTDGARGITYLFCGGPAN